MLLQLSNTFPTNSAARKPIADVCCMIAAKAQSEQADLGKRDRKTGYAPGEWDITKMAPKLKGQA